MKRLLIVTLLFLSVNVAFSQKYDKKIAASDKSIEDPKKGINPKTWISRGELFYEIAVAPTESLSSGMSEETYNLIIGQDVTAKATVQTETVNNKTYTVHIFDDKKVYIDNAAIQFWEVLKYETPNPMQKSHEAYVKAKSLDTGGKNAKKLKENLTLLATLSKNEAFNKFNLNKFPESVEFFSLSIDCSAETGVIDTLSIYYAGVLSIESKNYALAEKYLKQAIDAGYIEKGDTYAYLAEAMKELGKTDEARAILEKGFNGNPENQQLIIALINNYMSTGKDPKDIIPLITKAQEKEPGNINLYIVEGDLRERLGDIEGASKCYMKAMEISPDDFFGHYKLGLLYFNIGAKYSEQAVNEKDNKEYERLLELADTELKRALPFLEKAFELNQEEVSTIQALKEINFRFRNEENSSYQQNYDKFSKLLEGK
ncbi:MAG: tetratricopeptide repeat protein [Prevotellaceae bacterium]|jgi:tetratricopeptide (TPR) repeat protein|nr:tetratricopeptide repeat protein [Prevotellaceae bacterium]